MEDDIKIEPSTVEDGMTETFHVEHQMAGNAVVKSKSTEPFCVEDVVTESTAMNDMNDKVSNNDGSSTDTSNKTTRTTSLLNVDETPLKDEEWMEIPLNKRILLTVWHTMAGCLALLAWNTVLNALVILKTLWPGHNFINIVLGCNQAGAVTAVGTLIYLDKKTYSLWVARVLTVLSILVLAMMPLPALLYPGAENGNKAKGMYAVILFLLGITSGTYQTQSFAFATVVPRRRDQNIFTSTGNGISGVLTWLTFTICYEFIFEKNVPKQAAYLIVVMCVIAGLVVVANAFVQEICFAIPLFQRKLEATNRKDDPSVLEKQSSDEPPTLFINTFKQCIFPAFCVGFVLLITIFIFPGTGPLSWPLSPSQKNANIGVFQVLDLVFRFIPALGAWTILSKNLTRILIFSRPIILFPLFIIPAYLPTTPLLSNSIWLTAMIVLMVLSNGWGITCAIIHCMGTAKNKKEAETTANVMTMVIVLSALCGAFGSRIPLLGL